MLLIPTRLCISTAKPSRPSASPLLIFFIAFPNPPIVRSFCWIAFPQFLSYVVSFPFSFQRSLKVFLSNINNFVFISNDGVFPISRDFRARCFVTLISFHLLLFWSLSFTMPFSCSCFCTIFLPPFSCIILVFLFSFHFLTIFRIFQTLIYYVLVLC